MKQDIDAKTGAAIGAGAAAVGVGVATMGLGAIGLASTAAKYDKKVRAAKLKWIAYCAAEGIKSGMICVPKLPDVSPKDIMSVADINKLSEKQLYDLCRYYCYEDKLVAQYCLMESICICKDAEIIALIGAVASLGAGCLDFADLILSIPEVPVVFETITEVYQQMSDITSDIGNIRDITDAHASSQDCRRAFIAMAMEKRKRRIHGAVSL